MLQIDHEDQSWFLATPGGMFADRLQVRSIPPPSNQIGDIAKLEPEERVNSFFKQ
ncbi:MAG: hypothetical protein ABW096_13730 [Candidatus Thiodiazotropha sp.]